ncbi:Detected protein of confused Function [Hibiscus syriacus]|uniref:Detected protein of confused Function n=1 Tax=Hibiscus syriacus TaxID=106335 RepID=A0A6A3CM62_HIBSY|nr:Detected protein of confused Function [Hibiscus syriacus]
MEKTQSIPTIDFSDFPGQYEKLRKASEEWGCFRVVNHRIPLELMQEMKKVVRSLLDLPIEIKKNNTDVIASSGYWAPSTKNPLYEALGLYDMASSQAVRDFCSRLEASPSQRDTIEKYAQAINEMIMDIGGRIVESMGLNGDYCKDWPYDENVGGLEVDKSGEFVPVDPLPGSLLVNLGDMANVWSNGRLHTVRHRVQCKEATIRVSIATFLLGPKEATVEPPPELVDSDHPRLYKSFTYEEYRELRLSTKLQAGEALALVRTSA